MSMEILFTAESVCNSDYIFLLQLSAFTAMNKYLLFYLTLEFYISPLYNFPGS